MRLEVTLRELRSDAARNDEGMRRLRSLLAQAKVLLRESGVPFLEEDHSAGGVDGGRSGGGGRLIGSGEHSQWWLMSERELQRPTTQFLKVSEQSAGSECRPKLVIKGDA